MQAFSEGRDTQTLSEEDDGHGPQEDDADGVGQACGGKPKKANSSSEKGRRSHACPPLDLPCSHVLLLELQRRNNTAQNQGKVQNGGDAASCCNGSK